MVSINKDDNRQGLQSPKVSHPLATPSALALSNNFLASVRALRRDMVRSVHYLRVIHDRKIHRVLGYKTVYQYTQQEAGLTKNQTDLFLSLGRRLPDFPEVSRALALGELSWTKARLIVDKAQPEEEREWLEVAARMGFGGLQKALSKKIISENRAGNRKKQGDEDQRETKYGDEEQPGNSQEFSPGNPQKVAGGAPSPGAEFGERAPNPPSLKKRIEAPKCHVTFALTPEQYSVWASAMEVLRKRGERADKEWLLGEAFRGLVAGSKTCAGGTPYLVIIHHCPDCEMSQLRNARGSFEPPVPLLEVARCDGVEQGASQVRRNIIPPRIRKEVLRRDRHTCRGPNCHSTNYLEVHHRVPRALGGKTMADNLMTLCSRCHRMIHEREAGLQKAAKDPSL